MRKLFNNYEKTIAITMEKILPNHIQEVKSKRNQFS